MNETLRFFGTLDGVVELIEQEGQPDAGQQTEQEAAYENAIAVGIGGAERRLGLAHQINIRAANFRGDADFLQTLEHAGVKLFIGLDVVRQHGVLHRRVFQVERRLFLLSPWCRAVPPHYFSRRCR